MFAVRAVYSLVELLHQQLHQTLLIQKNETRILLLSIAGISKLLPGTSIIGIVIPC
jgi:hypothetical protein